jgi:hypothetical protein
MSGDSFPNSGPAVLVDADQPVIAGATAPGDVPGRTRRLIQGRIPPLRRIPLRVGHDVRRALVLTLVWEILSEIVGFAASRLIQPNGADTSATVIPRLFPGEHLNRYEALWLRWDGNWYTMLGMHGYGGHVSSVDAFFPAYPLLIHVVGFLLGGRYLLAGILINRLLLFPTVVVFTKLVRRDKSSNGRETELAPMMILLIPGTVFLLGALTETLFVFACLSAMLAIRRERWLLAAAACALASGTRLPGLVVVGMLGLELLLRREWLKAVYCSAIGLSGIGLYALYTLITQHDLLGFRDAYKNGSWNDQSFTLNLLRGPRRYFHAMVLDPPTKDYGGIITGGYMIALAAIVVLAVLCFKRLNWPLRLFVVGTALMPLLSGSMFSYYRYAMIPLLPMMVLATRWLADRPLWRDSVTLVLAGLAFFDIMAFASGHWVS